MPTSPFRDHLCIRFNIRAALPHVFQFGEDLNGALQFTKRGGVWIDARLAVVLQRPKRRGGEIINCLACEPDRAFLARGRRIRRAKFLHRVVMSRDSGQ